MNDTPEAKNTPPGDEVDGVAVDELHLTLRIPKDLPEEEVEAVRRALSAADFLDRLRRAVHVAVREFPELNAVRAALAR